MVSSFRGPIPGPRVLIPVRLQLQATGVRYEMSTVPTETAGKLSNLPSLTAMIAYVGSRGIHQPFRVDEASLVLPTKTPYGYLWPKVDALGNLFTAQCSQLDPNGTDPAGCVPPDPVNTNFGSVRSMFYIGHSYYNEP